MAQNLPSTTSKATKVAFWVTLRFMVLFYLVNRVHETTAFLQKTAKGQQVLYWLQISSLIWGALAVLSAFSLVPLLLPNIKLKLTKVKLLGSEWELKNTDKENENDAD
jgi:hypothetical protein